MDKVWPDGRRQQPSQGFDQGYVCSTGLCGLHMLGTADQRPLEALIVELHFLNSNLELAFETQHGLEWEQGHNYNLIYIHASRPSLNASIDTKPVHWTAKLYHPPAHDLRV